MVEEGGAAKPYDEDDKVHLFLAYFGIFSLIPFFVFKDKRADPRKEYVYWHARQGLALAVVSFAACIALIIVGIVLAFIPIVGWALGCLLWLFVVAGSLGGAVMGWIKAFGGQKWEMPGIAKIAEMFK